MIASLIESGRNGRRAPGAGRESVSPRKLPTKRAENRKAIRLIPLIGEQLKNKNVDGGMIPFRAKTMRQNNKKGTGGTEWTAPGGRRLILKANPRLNP